ncbi:Uncharacterised protein [Mycobacterium tuberculosis]|nr:Uncharacterised protein [Mycobacterium tuberculosis]
MVLEQFGDGAFGEHFDPRFVVAELGVVLLLQRDNLLLQGADQLQAGAVADVRQSRIGVSAEVALTDSAIVGAVEQRSLPIVLRVGVAHRGRAAAFGHDRVGLAE